jgi:HNH endonuclease
MAREGFPIKQIKNGDVIREFQNVAEAATVLGLNRSHIYACLKGARKSTGGFTFEKKDQYVSGEVWQAHHSGVEVSNCGRVKTQQGRISKGYKCKRYHQVKINQQHHYVHRLVLETFVGLAPEGCECDHIDRNPSNNNLENLRWVSHYDNMKNK